MKKTLVFSIAEAPGFPDFGELYKKFNIDELLFNTTRKAMTALKQTCPDIIVAEFLYGYGSNYAGVNVSNLDVFLYSLQKYSPDAKKIILVKKHERQFVDKLSNIFSLDAVLSFPINKNNIENIIREMLI